MEVSALEARIALDLILEFPPPFFLAFSLMAERANVVICIYYDIVLIFVLSLFRHLQIMS